MVNPKSKRNLIFVFLVFVSVGLLIFIVGSSTTYTIAPEAAEIAARRLDPSQNGYFLLEEASLMLRPPLPLWVPAEPGSPTLIKYRPEPNSLAALLDVEIPDDSPELLEYIISADKLLPKVREALQKPCIMLPIDWHDKTSRHFAAHQFSGRSSHVGVFQILVARAEIMSGENPASGEPVRLVKEALELGKIIRECNIAAPLGDSHWHFIYEIFKRAPKDLQKESLAWTLNVLEDPLSSDEAVLQHLRIYQAFVKDCSFFQRMIVTGWNPQRVIRNRDIMFAAARGEREELQRLVKSKAILLDYMNCHGICQETRLWKEGLARLAVILARELYRHDNGAYPSDIQALAPKYLPSLPPDISPEEKGP